MHVLGMHRAWYMHYFMHVPCISLVPRPFFPIIEREGEGEKRPGIHCTGGSARALNC